MQPFLCLFIILLSRNTLKTLKPSKHWHWQRRKEKQPHYSWHYRQQLAGISDIAISSDHEETPACHKGLRFLLWIPSYKIHHSLRFLLQYFFVHFYAQNCLNWRQSFPVAGSTLQPLTNVWISVGFASVKVKLQQYGSKAPATKQQTSNRKAKATSAPTTQQAVTNLFRNKNRIKLLCFIKMWRTGIDQVTNSCLH